MINKAIREEGAAARFLGGTLESNPYRAYAMKTDESIYWEHANEWRTGWITENKPVATANSNYVALLLNPR